MDPDRDSIAAHSSLLQLRLAREVDRRAGGMAPRDEDVFTDALERLERLTKKLAEKDRELAAVKASKDFAARDGEDAKRQAARAREELQQEVLRAALLEQQNARLSEETRSLAAQLRRVEGGYGLCSRAPHGKPGHGEPGNEVAHAYRPGARRGPC